MANKRLVSYVYVNGDLYGPDDDVPADVAEQITNPRAWGDDSESESKPAPAKKAAAKKASASSSK